MSDPFDIWHCAGTAPTHGVRIWMAGDYQQAKQVIRETCSKEGACFSISPMDYIYSGGEETGFCVTAINYPRFPIDPETLTRSVRALAVRLMTHLNQSSYTIEQYGGAESVTEFYSRRKSS